MTALPVERRVHLPPKQLDLKTLGLPMGTFILLAHTSRKLHHWLESSGGFGDLTPSQFYSLLILDENERLPLSKISEHIRRSPGNMTLVIDNLEKEGLVERQRSKEDRRVVMIELTAQGRERILKARIDHKAAVEQIMSVLTEEETQTLFALLQKFNQQYPVLFGDEEPAPEQS
jgi:MarR family 2-MHQ and catechol resistance regulon transcriptional repressor